MQTVADLAAGYVGTEPAGLWGGPTDTLVRPRVIEVLARGLGRPVTVVTAPPGYGKTVALRQLLGSWSGGGYPRSARRRPGSAGLLVAAGADLVERTDGATIAVVDRGASPLGSDTRDPAGVAVRAALAGSFPGIHFFYACRPGEAPALDPARSSEVAVVGEADLAFRSEEAGRLVREMSGSLLTDGELGVLMSWTDGWPVAVRLVAAALRSGASADDAVRGSGSVGRHLAAYVHQEILDREPDDLRRFLVRSSVLTEFDAPLCRAVGAGTRSAAAIRRLERERLLIRPDPTVPGSYRCLAPVRAVVRKELRQREPAAEARLLRSAAAWLLFHDRPDLAAPYLVEAEDWEQLIELIDRHGLRLWRDGRLGQAVGWLDRVPLHPRGRRQGVALRQVAALTLLGQSGRAGEISRTLHSRDLSTREQAVVDAMGAVRASRDARPVDAVTAGIRGIGQLGAGGDPEPGTLGLDDRHLRWLALTALVRAHWQVGDLDSSRMVFSILRRAGDVPPEILAEAGASLALAEAWTGNHRAARYRAAQVLARQGSGRHRSEEAVREALLALAHVHREEGDLGGADRWMSTPELGEEVDWSALSAAVLAVERSLAALAAGSPGSGLRSIRLFEARSPDPLPPLIEGRLRAGEVRLGLMQGDVGRAEHVLGNFSGPWTPALAGAAVQAALAGGDLDLAVLRLGGWPSGAADPLGVLEKEMWTAVVEFDTGRRRQALRRAGRLVAIAEQRGCPQLLMDGGPPVARLLRSVARTAPGSRPAGGGEPGRPGGAPLRAPLGLSAREREIIRYLPTPLSSTQMAARLFISVNTLKTHLRTIYRKLGVNSRREAIGRAEELGLA